MRLISPLVLLLALAAPTAVLADPVGKFDIRGINPDDGKDYTGTVKVTRTGQTYKVVWSIANGDLIGTGIGIKMIDGKAVLGPASEGDVGISIAYGSGETFGTVIYFEQPDGHWHGTWAYNGWDRISTEDWFPKGRKNVARIEKQDDKQTRAIDTQLSTPMPALAGPKN
ncbi:MAG: hypothetical protein JWM58_2571 [Rhizobium sp.]|nr:hypothetical protein [Rhizobium sp.]